MSVQIEIEGLAELTAALNRVADAYEAAVEGVKTVREVVEKAANPLYVVQGNTSSIAPAAAEAAPATQTDASSATTATRRGRRVPLPGAGSTTQSAENAEAPVTQGQGTSGGGSQETAPAPATTRGRRVPLSPTGTGTANDAAGSKSRLSAPDASNVAADISDSDLSKAATSAALKLTPARVHEIIGEFKVLNIQKMDQGQRRQFLDRLKKEGGI